MKTILITLMSLLSVAAVVTVIIIASTSMESASNDDATKNESASLHEQDSENDLDSTDSEMENQQEDTKADTLEEASIIKEVKDTETEEKPESSTEEDIAENAVETSDETYEIVEDTSDDIDLSETSEETIIVEEATEETSAEKPGETYEAEEPIEATSENENNKPDSSSDASGTPGANQDTEGLSLEDLIEELRAAGFDDETIAAMIVEADSGMFPEPPQKDERAYLVPFEGNIFFNGSEQVYTSFSVSAVEPIITRSEDRIHVEERGGSIGIYENVGVVFENNDTLNAQYMEILRTNYDRDDMVYVLIWDLDFEITVIYDRYGNLFEY